MEELINGIPRDEAVLFMVMASLYIEMDESPYSGELLGFILNKAGLDFVGQAFESGFEPKFQETMAVVAEMITFYNKKMERERPSNEIISYKPSNNISSFKKMN